MPHEPASHAVQAARILELEHQLAGERLKVELADLRLEEWEAAHQYMPTALPS